MPRQAIPTARTTKNKPNATITPPSTRATRCPAGARRSSVIAAASKRQIVARILVNLAGIYGRMGDLPRSLDVLERLAVLEPSNPRIARDLAQLRERVDGLN